MAIVANYTPHTIRVRLIDGGQDYVYPASGEVARVPMTTEVSTPIHDGCPTSTVVYGDVALPAGHPPVCIVSAMFADAYRRQHGAAGDVALLVPDTGPSAVREDGQIVAVRSLIRR